MVYSRRLLSLGIRGRLDWPHQKKLRGEKQ
jgi:hypothetical protein